MSSSRQAPQPVAVSTPGKLILMGEHAAVYGRPALVAAVDLRLTARFSPHAGTGIRLDLPGLAHSAEIAWGALRAYCRSVQDAWTAYALRPDAAGFHRVRGADPAHIVKAALGEADAALAGSPPDEDDSPPLHLEVDSQLPIGSGFGSSAAAAVAVIAGYLAYRGRAADFGTIERLALEAERRQHGLPSGIDTAAVLRGGLLWARRREDGSLEVEAVAARSPLLSHLRVYGTGTPAEATGAVVAAVRERSLQDPARHARLMDRMEAAVRAFRDQLLSPREEPERIVGLIREHESCMEELGVVPPPVCDIVRRIEASGGAAKVSGAGALTGSGAGSLLIYHSAPELIDGWSFLRGLSFHPVRLGAAGFRKESE